MLNAIPIDTPLAAHRNESFCGEGDLALLRGLVVEHGHEERFADEQTLARAHQRAHQALGLLRAIAEDGFHLNAIFDVHHRAGLGDHRLFGVQLDLYELQIVADDLVVDFVHGGHRALLIYRVGMLPGFQP